MTAQLAASTRFVRKTQLRTNEYHKNFHKIDQEIIAALTSREADKVTPLMSKIYLRLVSAPVQYFEREGVLRFESEVREQKILTSWSVLCDLVGVASATASKALTWMHEQGIIGYFAGKNGVGIRIFLNRAAGSIGVRAQPAYQKNLSLVPASSRPSRASAGEAAFNDTYGVLENSDIDFNSHALRRRVVLESVVKDSFEQIAASLGHDARDMLSHYAITPQAVFKESVQRCDEILSSMKSELTSSLQVAAKQAAAVEHERTRQWLETKGLPKAARVAQREAYNVLRKHGVINEGLRSKIMKATGSDYTPPEPHLLSECEITEMAEICAAMLEVKGQPVEVTLSEMSVASGGFLLAEDVPRIREKADYIICAHETAETPDSVHARYQLLIGGIKLEEGNSSTRIAVTDSDRR